MDLSRFRQEYCKEGLKHDMLHTNPFEQLKIWMAQAIKSQIPDPNAVVLATVDVSGSPSQRIVLLKDLSSSGLIFYTNYSSRKSKDINSHPYASLHFPWYMLERQVSVEGKIKKLSTETSKKYFFSRPHESQLGAWASYQSKPIKDRSVLTTAFETLKKKYPPGKVPFPDFWGGYSLLPCRIEFWQGGLNRLHDRFVYQQIKNNWVISRLSP